MSCNWQDMQQQMPRRNSTAVDLARDLNVTITVRYMYEITFRDPSYM